MPQPCVLTAVVYTRRSHRSTHMLSPCKFGLVQTGSYLVRLYAPSPKLRTRTVQSSGQTEPEPELNHQFGSAGLGLVHQFRTELRQPYPFSPSLSSLFFFSLGCLPSQKASSHEGRQRHLQQQQQQPSHSQFHGVGCWEGGLNQKVWKGCCDHRQ